MASGHMLGHLWWFGSVPDPTLLLEGVQHAWWQVVQDIRALGQQVCAPLLSWLQAHEEDLVGGLRVVRHLIVKGDAVVTRDGCGSIQLTSNLQPEIVRELPCSATLGQPGSHPATGHALMARMTASQDAEILTFSLLFPTGSYAALL